MFIQLPSMLPINTKPTTEQVKVKDETPTIQYTDSFKSTIKDIPGLFPSRFFSHGFF